MIAQLLLSAGLSVCLFYVISIGRELLVLRLSLLCVVFAGYVFIWLPELTNSFAGLVGIGRGADLVIYLWILMSLFLILKLHIKLRVQSESVTKIVRHLALTNFEHKQ